jgi:hypothetical protein
MEAKTNECVAKGERMRMSMVWRRGHASLIGGQLSKFVNSSSDTSVGVAELRGGGGTVRFCVDLPEQANITTLALTNTIWIATPARLPASEHVSKKDPRGLAIRTRAENPAQQPSHIFGNSHRQCAMQQPYLGLVRA